MISNEHGNQSAYPWLILHDDLVAMELAAL